MINSTLDYIGIIVAGVLLIRLAYAFLPRRIQLFVPLVLVIYLLYMTLGSLQLFASNIAIENSYRSLLGLLIPLMIFLMLLQFRLDLFRRLGRKMVIAFFTATLSLILAFTLVYTLLQSWLFEGANAYFATLAGSWSGGTANMLAVAEAIQLPKDALGPVIAVDSVLYGMWLMFLLALVPIAAVFNRFTHADSLQSTAVIPSSYHRLTQFRWALPLILFVLLSVHYLLEWLIPLLPHTQILSSSFLSIILATLLGLAGSFTPLGHITMTQTLAQYMLYFIIALIASQASFAGLTTLGLFLFAALFVLILHAAFMVISAKLFKLDLFSIGVASLSHIGGIASAPVLAGAYHRSLIPIGVAMAATGYLLGTLVGLFIAWILQAL